MQILVWIGFVGLVVALLALDLGVFHRRAHAPSARESLAWTAFWIVLALVFNAGVYFIYEHHFLGIGEEVGHTLGGGRAALQFFTAYIVEKSLSVDNIFVIAIIFAYFRVPPEHQHRVLFWGILGALVMRGVMIAVGVALLRRFEWLDYVLGGVLVLTAVRMLLWREENIDPEKMPAVRLIRRFYPVVEFGDRPRFFGFTADGRRAVTTLFLALVVIETMDVLFAIDSIPAVFAVTRDPFIAFTSNVFAILGLRSLYFVLAAAIRKFRYLKFSLIIILAFVGVKLILAHHYEIPLGASLVMIALLLAGGVAASLLLPPPNSHDDPTGAPRAIPGQMPAPEASRATKRPPHAES